jgi:hypothetical protein
VVWEEAARGLDDLRSDLWPHFFCGLFLCESFQSDHCHFRGDEVEHNGMQRGRVNGVANKVAKALALGDQFLALANRLVVV